MTLSNLKGLSELASMAMGKVSKQILSVSVDDVISKEQVRKRFRNIEELATTLITEGQQSPIIVSPKNENGKYVIQKGERRWRACKHADIPTIDIIINDKEQGELDETAGELIENIQRDNLAPLEIAEALNRFSKDGWKNKDIAQRLGVNNSFVSSHLSLLKMPACVREIYDGDISSDTETLNNLRQLFDLDPECCRAICALANTDGITRKHSRELLNDAKRRVQEDQATAQENDKSNAGGENNSDPLYTEQENKDEAEVGVAPEKQDKLKRTTITEGEDALNPLEKAREWKMAKANTLIITVYALVNDDTLKGVKDDVIKGIIMTDRVALNPSTVWVKTLDQNGKETHINVPASNIEIISIEG